MGTEPRLDRERRTVVAMVRLYCRHLHRQPAGQPVPCPECERLLDYTRARLERCPYGPAKPTCANCPIHCYRPAERESARTIMRFSGPRMLWRHPWLAILHLLDGFRRPPLPRRLGKDRPRAS